MAAARPQGIPSNWVSVNGGWVPPDHPLAQQAQSQPAAAPAAPPPTAQPQATPANTTPTPESQFANAIYSTYQSLQAPVDANSASIKAQTQAYDLTSGRNLADTNRTIAEQAYASGQLGAGGTAVAQQQAKEAASAARSSFMGNAVKDAETARQSQLMTTLGLGAQTEASRNSLAQQGDEFAKTQAQQQDEYNRTLAENKRQFDANKDQEAAQFAQSMGFNYAQLNEQDKQFVQNLAWQKQQDALNRAFQEKQLAASQGAAGAANARENEALRFQEEQYYSTHPDELIDAMVKAQIAQYNATTAGTN